VRPFYPAPIRADFDWNRWVGVPYQTWGRGPLAYDCWGLTRSVILAGLGIRLPAFAHGYTDTGLDGDVPPLIAGHLAAGGEWFPVTLAQARPLDILLFRVGGRVNHIGPVIQPGWFLNISRTRGSGPESYTRATWAHRIEACYRAMGDPA